MLLLYGRRTRKNIYRNKIYWNKYVKILLYLYYYIMKMHGGYHQLCIMKISSLRRATKVSNREGIMDNLIDSPFLLICHRIIINNFVPKNHYQGRHHDLIRILRGRTGVSIGSAQPHGIRCSAKLVDLASEKYISKCKT